MRSTAASSSRLYYEDAKSGTGYRHVKNPTPTGVAVFPGNFRSMRKLAERTHNIVHWSEFDRGGHYADFVGVPVLQTKIVKSLCEICRKVDPW